MDTNLEIAFHNMDPQPELDAYIRERAEKLEKLFDRMVGMRVAVEKPSTASTAPATSTTSTSS